MVSKASDDLPDPLTPVTMISLPVGSVTSMFLRLCVRAPRTTSGAASTTLGAAVSDMLFGVLFRRWPKPISYSTDRHEANLIGSTRNPAEAGSHMRSLERHA